MRVIYTHERVPTFRPKSHFRRFLISTDEIMILIDANVALEYKKIPLFHHKREIAFTKPVLKELEQLAITENEKVLPELIKGVQIVETTEQFADNSIIEAALKHNLKVATFDKILVQKLKKRGVDVLMSRGEIISALHR